MKVNPDELLGISKAIDSIKSAFPAVIEAEPVMIGQPLRFVQESCDQKYKEVTGLDPKDLK